MVFSQYSETEMRRKLKGRTEITDAIIPKHFSIGCRRPTPGEGFLESLIAPNTTVHTKQMQRIAEDGFIAHDGTTEQVDVIVCATGFDTSWIPRFPVHAHGKNLQDVWAKDGPLSYLAVGVPEFPNFFWFVGPVSINSSKGTKLKSGRNWRTSSFQYGPLVVGSLLTIVELFTEYMISVITKMQVENIKSLAPKMAAARAFREHHDLFMQRTAWSGPCSSWFKKGDPNGSLQMYPGSRVHFFELLAQPRYEDYEIKYASSNQWEYLGNGFHVREFDGRDTTYYLGFLNGVDRQPQFDENILPRPLPKPSA
jgi:hypothetical protein